MIKVWESSYFLIDCAEGRSYDEIAERVETDTQTDFQDDCCYTIPLFQTERKYQKYMYCFVNTEDYRDDTWVEGWLVNKKDNSLTPSGSYYPYIYSIMVSLQDDPAFPFALSTHEDIPNSVRVKRLELHEHMSLGCYIYYETNKGEFVFVQGPDDWYLFRGEDFPAIARKMYDNVLEQTADGMLYGGPNPMIGLDIDEWKLENTAS